MYKLAVVLIENRFDTTKILLDHLFYLPENSKGYIFDNIKSIDEYNNLLTSVEFWNRFEEENILIIQHDSALLKKGIEEFYEWDYVGAPWKFQQHGGNGGLSFRKKSAMIECVNRVPYINTPNNNEDIYFSNALTILNKKLAPREICEKFSCETIFKMETMGYHAIDRYLSEYECNLIKNQYK